MSASAPTAHVESPVPRSRAPGSSTAPAVVRASMVAQPWSGWKDCFRAALGTGPSPKAPEPSNASVPAEWERAASVRRRALLLIVAFATVLATSVLAREQWGTVAAPLSYLQTALFVLLFAWVSAGCLTAVMGLFVLLRDDAHQLSIRTAGRGPIAADARTALIMPICHEDVSTAFAGLRATCESLAATGALDRFDIFVLSDSSDADVYKAEVAAWAELRAAIGGGRVHYRRRKVRTQRKAGNVADFCRRWGRCYRYMVVLDADSVMTGDCLTTLVRLMEAHPRAGILQTAPQSFGHATLHARAQQFASRVAGRLFTAGMQYWQLGESHYWGHNAIIRVEPFMRHCALARLPGDGVLSGEVLSHDFVEAALMRRAGWQVWMAHDLPGSYEQAPPHLLAELQRDRRWCQGNLQNVRLIAQPRLHAAHRALLATGALAYVSAPLWLLYVLLGAGPWLLGSSAADAADGPWANGARSLWIATLGMLALPRGLGVLAIVLRREQAAYGGGLRLTLSAVLEAGLSFLQAPLRMVAHTSFVIGAFGGWRLNWTSPPRRGEDLGWVESAQRFAPASLSVVAIGLAIGLVHPQALLWLIPIGLPLLLAIPIATWTSRSSFGERCRAAGLLWVPEESQPPAVLRRATALQLLARTGPAHTGSGSPWHPMRPDPVAPPP